MAERHKAGARYPGVWWRELRSGERVYEIVYRDSSGAQRTQTIRGGLKAAQAALAEIKAKQARGERVGATRQTLNQVAHAWLDEQTGSLRPKTREIYESGLRLHVLPRLGRRRIARIDEDDVAGLIAEMRAEGYSEWTIAATISPLSRILGHALRRGWIPRNPVKGLERGERPKQTRRDVQVLDAEELTRLLDAATPLWRPLIATAAYTGLRRGELLALTWPDVDFERGLVRVRHQLDAAGRTVEPKTDAGRREVAFIPALGRILREHRAASRYSAPGDPVFVTATGRPQNPRNSGRGLTLALDAAGLGDRKLRLHDLRHTFASWLISEGLDVVYVSRQLGHASPTITLNCYAHLFDRARHENQARERLGQSAFGDALRVSNVSATDGNQAKNGLVDEGAQVVDLQELRRRRASS